MAVSSKAQHALPDPSYHPVRAADGQHTLACMARPAEQRSRTAVCRVSRRRGEHVTMITRNYINFRNFYYFEEFLGIFAEPSIHGIHRCGIS